MTVTDLPRLLRMLFDRAIEVADPMQIVARHLLPRPSGRVVVVGAGKASARMAEAVEAAWGPCEGLVITRYGHARPTAGIRIVEAGHPVPDQAGADATAQMLDLLAGLGQDDLAIALISGGASSLLVAPVAGLPLSDKQAVNAALLASGAPIDRMNVVRKHLSRVKGGQLAAAAFPARMLALIISDVPGDNPAFIGSGPTVAEGSTPQDARDVLTRWNVAVPGSVMAALQSGSGVVPLGDPRLERVENRVIAAPMQSLQAAAELAAGAGCDVRILDDRIEGEAREIGAAHAALARREQAARISGAPPLVLLSGGELTVTRRGSGVGGPNAEYALALVVALDSAPGIHGLACDTDGIDGAADVAGAQVGPDTLRRARAEAADPAQALSDNDAHNFFEAIGGQIITGPTRTNVNDFRALLILPR